MSYKITKTEEEWKQILTQAQYHVLREQGTEPAFCGLLYNNHEPGKYFCAACKTAIFSSDNKFESGTGWPSFFQPISEDLIEFKEDKSYGMVRTEVNCATCGSHLGHVFPDGPKPTGLRYCVNSISLNFKANS